MKKALYIFWQCTWGFLQSFMGLCLFLRHVKDPHTFYHGAVVTHWQQGGSISLGLFVFVAPGPGYVSPSQGTFTKEELSSRLLVHEYGHTIQSLVLGPLYLIIIGIPSFLWANTPRFARMRREKKYSYFRFFTESWANLWGEKVTKQKSMEKLVIS